MKLLLTSGGIRNNTIAQAVLDLVGLPAEKIQLVFIPTAANIESGDKGWLIDDLRHFQEQGYESIDILDIAGLSQEEWLPRIEDANLICFGGGNEQYLAKILRTSGLGTLLPELLKTRVYMGISAGSMVAGNFMSRDLNRIVYPDDTNEGPMESSLYLVNLTFIPHLNSPHFPEVRRDILKNLKISESVIYSPDDHSALKIVDGDIEIIGGGETFVSRE